MRAASRIFAVLQEKPSLRVGLAVVIGLTLGFVIVPRVPIPDDPNSPAPEVRILGGPLTLDDQAVEQALARIREHLLGNLQLRVPGGPNRSYSYAELGVKIDTIRLKQLVLDARDRTSPLRRLGHNVKTTPRIDLPLPLVLGDQRAHSLLKRLKDELDFTPLTARYDVSERKVVPEREGRSLDLDQTLVLIKRALERGGSDAELVFRKQTPPHTARDLAAVNIDHVLGAFETAYDRSQKSEARTYNLKLAASRLDGTVLMPGEIFDFNAVVGPRDEASGYQVAPVIAQGELVDGVGGGTCQISGTLHGAAFFSGLEIVERYPHTRPSSYIKMGLDATVVYPTINFRFKNSLSFPVVVHQTVSQGKVRAEILGSQAPPSITLIRRIESASAYEEVERPEPRLALGKRVLLQRGVPGFKLKRYRIVRRGQHAVREGWADVYPPTSQIIRVGTGVASDKASSYTDDPHPEYLADELLVLSTREPDEAQGFDLRERREPGRFGSAGWTKEAGMPFYNNKP